MTRPIVLVVAHRKGGVGKTTTVVHLATGLAALGLPVVAIDLDPQGNLGEFLGLGRASDVFDLLMCRRPVRFLPDALTPLPAYPSLRLILGDDETKAAERALSAPESRRSLVSSLQAILDGIRSLSDQNGRRPLILLDTPPGLGSLQLAALSVAHFLIIPVNPAFASETGLPKLAEEVQLIRQKSERGARLLAILPTRFKARTIEHRAILQNLQDTFGPALLYPPVRDTVRLEEAPARGLPIWDYDRDSIGARDYAQVLIRLARDLGIPVHLNGNGNGHGNGSGREV